MALREQFYIPHQNLICFTLKQKTEGLLPAEQILPEVLLLPMQVERVLNGSPCSLDSGATEIIKRHGRLYAERILSAIAEAGFDLKAVPSDFMGGGSAIMKRHVTPQDQLF